MKRTHDQFYLQEDSLTVKQSFIEVADEIESYSPVSIADVGCATGAFPNYLSKRFPTSKVYGIEYLEPLLEKARIDFPQIDFIHGNILDKASVQQTFDVITMLGVLSIFDDYCAVLNTAINWLKPKGILILHNMISEYEIDVFVKYKTPASSFDPAELESGWNILSQKSLELALEGAGAKIKKIKNFTLKTTLNKQNDTMRSWTEIGPGGENEIYNALHIRQPHKIIVIEKTQIR